MLHTCGRFLGQVAACSTHQWWSRLAQTRLTHQPAVSGRAVTHTRYARTTANMETLTTSFRPLVPASTFCCCSCCSSCHLLLLPADAAAIPPFCAAAAAAAAAVAWLLLLCSGCLFLLGCKGPQQFLHLCEQAAIILVKCNTWPGWQRVVVFDRNHLGGGREYIAVCG